MATITRVSSQDANASGTISLTMTYPQTPTQGNFLVCVPREEGGGGWTAQPSGWTRASGNGSASFSQDIWYKVAGASEPTAVTFDAANSTTTNGFIYEFSGITQTTPLDTNLSGSSAVTNSLSPAASTTGKTSQADTLVIGAWLWRTDVQTFVSWSNGFTDLGNLAGALFVAYKVIRVIDSPTMKITVTGSTAGNLYPIMATFKGTTNYREVPVGRALSVGDGMSRSEVAN